VSGATRVAGVIGYPVAHSLSPALHNAAFAAAGLDWVHVALPVRAGRAAAAVAAMDVLGLRGLSVTMPHKTDVVGAAHRASTTVARLGAANTLVATPNGVLAESTDGAGLLAALAVDHAWSPPGQVAVVLGAGGAARAVTLALADAGAARVVVVARRPEAAATCAALAGRRGQVGTVEVVGEADLVVDATSVGMAGAGLPLQLDPARLAAGQLVVDLVYAPPSTALLVAASAAGATAVNGLGMLLHQAALQFELWTGVPAPIAAMRAALRAPREAQTPAARPAEGRTAEGRLSEGRTAEGRTAEGRPAEGRSQG